MERASFAYSGIEKDIRWVRAEELALIFMEYEKLLSLMILTGMILLSVVMMVRITFLVKKTPAFWSYLAAHIGLLICLIGAFLGTVAPTKPLTAFYETIQFVGLLLVFSGWLLFCGNYMARAKCEKKNVLFLAVTGLSVLSTGILIMVSDEWYMRIPAIFLFIVFIYCMNAIFKDHFVALSSGAFDIFMQKIGEVVYVFGDKGDLIGSTPLNSPIKLDTRAFSTFAEFKEYMKAHVIGKHTGFFQDNNHIGEATRQEEIKINLNHHDMDCILSITPLRSASRKIGTVISLRDISQEKELERNLALKNMELQEINMKLQDFIAIEHQLEEEKVRNQIVTEIHSTVGERITQTLFSLEEIQKYEAAEMILSRKRLEKVTEDCRLVLEHIREVVGKLKPQNKKTNVSAEDLMRGRE